MFLENNTKRNLHWLKVFKQSAPGPSSDLQLTPISLAASGLPADFFSPVKPADAERVSSKDSSHSLLLGDYEEEEDEEEEQEMTEAKEKLPPAVQDTTLQKAAAATVEAPDHSENKTAPVPVHLVSHSGSIQKAEVQEKIVERKQNTAEALPEGFFDDPEVDAKARTLNWPQNSAPYNSGWLKQQRKAWVAIIVAEIGLKRNGKDVSVPEVLGYSQIFCSNWQPQCLRESTVSSLSGERWPPSANGVVRKVDAPKDQMDKEWDEFQKAMRQVNTISEAIVAEEDEEGRLDRQIGEIDEQIECFRRVEQLRDRQEVMREKLKEAMSLKATQAREGEDLGSEDEGELQDLLSQDWRAKGALL
uniref:Uncharacterized protein n=1 Tax=Sphaerodactylus townsendi TaxID=933632 RepID=A0ACB8FUV1_9SAUR